MNRILKYDLAINDNVDIVLPTGATPLWAGIQQGGLKVWVLGDDEVDKFPRRFHVVGTNHPADHLLDAKFIGTIFYGEFVWHVFVENS